MALGFRDLVQGAVHLLRVAACVAPQAHDVQVQEQRLP